MFFLNFGCTGIIGTAVFLIFFYNILYLTRLLQVMLVTMKATAIILKTLPLGIILLIVPSTNCDGPEQPTLTQQQKDSIRRFIRDIMDCNEIQGMTLTVVNKEEVVMSEGFGFADAETRKPVTSSTLFPIASVSKGFTSVLLAMLLHGSDK